MAHPHSVAGMHVPTACKDNQYERMPSTKILTDPV